MPDKLQKLQGYTPKQQQKSQKGHSEESKRTMQILYEYKSMLE